MEVFTDVLAALPRTRGRLPHVTPWLTHDRRRSHGVAGPRVPARERPDLAFAQPPTADIQHRACC
jgi:hypothetical protein